MTGMAGMPGMTGNGADTLEAASGRMILPMMRDPMIPGLEGVRPAVGSFVPGTGRDLGQLREATPSARVRVHDGDTLTLVASIVRRTIAGRTTGDLRVQWPGTGAAHPGDAGRDILRAVPQ